MGTVKISQANSRGLLVYCTLGFACLPACLLAFAFAFACLLAFAFAFACPPACLPARTGADCCYWVGLLARVDSSTGVLADVRAKAREMLGAKFACVYLLQHGSNGSSSGSGGNSSRGTPASGSFLWCPCSDSGSWPNSGSGSGSASSGAPPTSGGAAATAASSPASTANRHPQLTAARIPSGVGLLSQVASTGRALHLADARSHPLFRREVPVWRHGGGMHAATSTAGSCTPLV